MTEDEADEILFLMSQLWWSGHPPPDGTLSVWHTSLMHLERDAAIECVHELAGEKPYWPAISDFRSHYTARVRRKQGLSDGRNERCCSLLRVCSYRAGFSHPPDASSKPLQPQVFLYGMELSGIEPLSETLVWIT